MNNFSCFVDFIFNKYYNFFKGSDYVSDVRIPTQKRSIEKRNKIIEKGFELMCEEGYYRVGTTEIAKASGVSTGIIYQYFNDKKDIFLEGVKNYSDKIMYPMLNVLENQKIDLNNLNNILNVVIEKLIKTHTISKKAHEELLAMSHLDEDVSNVFKQSEITMTNKIAQLLENNGIIIKNEKEKIHVIASIVDNFCHEIVYHKHEELNYDAMKKYVIELIINTLK